MSFQPDSVMKMRVCKSVSKLLEGLKKSLLCNGLCLFQGLLKKNTQFKYEYVKCQVYILYINS